MNNIEYVLEMSTINVKAKFALVNGKINFIAENTVNDKKVALANVTSIEEVLEAMLKELSMSIFNIVDIFKMTVDDPGWGTKVGT